MHLIVAQNPPLRLVVPHGAAISRWWRRSVALGLAALVACGFEPTTRLEFEHGGPDSTLAFRIVSPLRLSGVLSVPGEPKTLVAVGGHGAIVRSLDAGATWAAVKDSGTNSARRGVPDAEAAAATPLPSEHRERFVQQAGMTEDVGVVVRQIARDTA